MRTRSILTSVLPILLVGLPLACDKGNKSDDNADAKVETKDDTKAETKEGAGDTATEDGADIGDDDGGEETGAEDTGAQPVGADATGPAGDDAAGDDAAGDDGEKAGGGDDKDAGDKKGGDKKGGDKKGGDKKGGDKKGGDKVDLAKGKEIFGKKCDTCHGPKGNADTKLGKKHKIPDWTEPGWKGKWSVAKIEKIVRNGKSGTKMKPFKDKLSDEEIKAVSAYARSLGK